MSSTKIINVLKDDSFDEILDLFKATSAEEVIFVLPKSARAFKKEDHFASLRDESKSLGKAVSFLCSNPDVNEIAKKYKFDVLLARSPVPRKPARVGKANLSETVPAESGSIDVVNEIEDFYSEPATSEDSISISKPHEDIDADFESEDSLEEEPVSAVTAVANQDNRRLDDIFMPEVKNQQNVKVSGGREKIVPIEVNHNVFGQGLSARGPQSPKSLWRFLPKFGSRKEGTSRRPAHRTGLIVLSCLAVVVLGVVVFMSTGKAQVTIKPSSENLDFMLTVFASDNVSSIILNTLAIPGQLFNIQKTVSQDFTATGQVDVAQKARGTVTVYNELTTEQPLVVTTRFESADRHIFRTLTSIVVPPAKISNGKLVPGSKDVQVIADKAGQDYNVPVGLFTIPAFKEQGATEKYQKVYGQSTAPILNGTSGKSTVVTETDLNAAKQALTTQLTTSVQDELNSQIDGLKIINSGQIVVGSPVSTTPADAKATTFKVNLSGSLKTIGFKESDLHALIAQYVDTQKNKMVLGEKLTITYENPRWDDTKNGLSFTIRVSGPGYSKIDEQKIIADLLGKNDVEMRAYLGKIAGISSAHVSLSPFWVRSIPKNKDRVTVDISY